MWYPQVVVSPRPLFRMIPVAAATGALRPALLQMKTTTNAVGEIILRIQLLHVAPFGITAIPVQEQAIQLSTIAAEVQIVQAAGMIIVEVEVHPEAQVHLTVAHVVQVAASQQVVEAGAAEVRVDHLQVEAQEAGTIKRKS